MDSKKYTASVVAHVAGARFVLLDTLAVDADAGISLANETIGVFRDLVESLKGSVR